MRYSEFANKRNKARKQDSKPSNTYNAVTAPPELFVKNEIDDDGDEEADHIENTDDKTMVRFCINKIA
jgi:hypothetical protein